MIQDGEILQIGPFKIKIYLRSEEYLGGDEGRWMSDSHTIFVKEELTNDRQIEALWHELIHAISDIYGLEITENQTRILSLAQITLLKENTKCLNLADHLKEN